MTEDMAHTADVQRPASALLILPQGMTVTGITTWAVRVASRLAAAGRAVGLVVHGGAAGFEPLDAALDPGLRVWRRDDLPPIEALNGDLSALVAFYHAAARQMAAAHPGPVCLVPTRHGDCFGACAQITMVDPELVRVIGWQHVASDYEDALLTRYEPVCAQLVGVSAHIAERLRTRFPGRTADIWHLPNAIETPASRPAREPAAGRTVRLLYTGRVEHEQKRVRALVAMSDALTERGIEHELVLLGDGPASGEIDTLARTRPAIRRVPSVPPDDVPGYCARADVFVLASRTEGLSVSLLEAMAAGCVPVITDTPSGASEAVEDGRSGVLVPFADLGPDSDDALGRRLAEAVAGALDGPLAALSEGAWARARDRFDARDQAERTAQVFDRAGLVAPRAWRSDRAPAFSAGAGGPRGPGGSTPADAAERLRSVLAGLAGRRLAIHGTGRHTIELAGVLAEPGGAGIVGFCDDEPARQGERLWGWPVVAPSEAARLGASDVVISSWLHEATIWSRRAVYEDQGLTVHRLYA